MYEYVGNVGIIDFSESYEVSLGAYCVLRDQTLIH
jgi:hypothetical protein